MHKRNCPMCKVAFLGMLQVLFKDASAGYNLRFPTAPNGSSEFKLPAILPTIHEKLSIFRNQQDFIKKTTLNPCDYFIPSMNSIIELDERQHFTPLRALALKLYPKNMKLQFPKKRWIELCEAIHAKDNYPVYRDEQRAWYDTLRDFAPGLTGLSPTIRIYAGDLPWCELNPKSKADVKRFKEVVFGTTTV